MPARTTFTLVCAILSCCIQACGGDSPQQPSCAYAVTAGTQAFSAAGGAGTASIGTGATCPWSAAADSAWVTVSRGSGTGPATVEFAVAANSTSTARTATLTIAGRALPVNQDGRTPCEYVVSPSSLDVVSSGGGASLTVTAAEGCAWTALSSDSWVAVGSPSSGSGNGTVAVTIQSNSATSDRATSLTVAGRSIPVRQAGGPVNPPQPYCEYSVSPADTVMHWHATGLTLNISTSPGCPWTVATSDAWLGVDRTVGTGAATVAVSFSQFTDDATRRAAVQVRWPTPTAGQNAWVTQEGCRYGVEPSASFPADGGARSATVVTQPISPSCSIGCPWTAVSNAPWIHVTSSMPRAGDDVFSYQVDPNPGAARVGTVAVAGRVHTVTQAGS